jgi:hypothetical protein
MKFRIALIAALLTLAAVAVAGTVADRTSAITLTLGAGTWTNTVQYASVEIDRIDIISNKQASDTVTVSRVTSDSAMTNTIATITITTGAGSYNIVPTTSTGPKFLLYGDKVVFATTSTSNGVAYIDYKVAKH